MEQVVNITNKNSQKNDLKYWLSKTPTERLKALEELRNQYLRTLPENERRLKRVIRVIKRKKS